MATPRRPVSRVEWLVPVLALDLLVLSYVLVQLVALVGGDEHVRRTSGLTYAAWAGQGFAQLLAVTALTLVVVGVAAARAPLATARDRLLARLGLGAALPGALVAVGTALRRRVSPGPSSRPFSPRRPPRRGPGGR